MASGNQHTPVWSPSDFRDTVAALWEAGLFRPDLFQNEPQGWLDMADAVSERPAAPVIDIRTRERLA